MTKNKGIPLALPATIVLVVCFALPMLYSFIISITTQEGIAAYRKFFSDSFYVGILSNTVLTAFQVTVLVLLLGYPTAYYLARTRSKFKNIMLMATVFPFLVSALIRAYGWVVILGDNGMLNQLLLAIGVIQAPLKIMYTKTAVIVGLVHLLLPYMILAVASVLQGVDGNLEAAAQSLGASKFQTFRRVVFPLSLPGVITGCILVFTVSMTSYVTPKLLGGPRVRMMSTMVAQEVQITFNQPMASAISFILLGAILVFLLIANLSTQNAMNRLGGGKR